MIPKVSAVIITHNRLELVKKAYFSVVNQDYSNIEIIIVDDASTDGTKEYFESIERKNTRYIYIYHLTNRKGEIMQEILELTNRRVNMLLC